MHRALRALSGALLLVAAAPALGQDSAFTGQPLRYDLTVDGSIAGGSIAAWILTETLFKADLAPAACRVCGTEMLPNGDIVESVNGVDRTVRNHLVWQTAKHDNRGLADTLSNATAFGLVPVAAIGYDLWQAHDHGSVKEGYVDLLVLAEAVGLAADLTQATKFAVGRERPFVHVLPPDVKALTKNPVDNNLSFFSGHSSFTFAVAVAAGTVAEERGYRYAPAVYGVGLTLAAFTGYLRIAADKHYFSDVVTGALVGSAIGFAVPWFMHRMKPGAGGGAGAIPSPGGLTLVF